MSDPTTIANLLQSTLMGTTESIRKTEQVLQQLQKDRPFLTNLLIVVREKNLQKNIRKAAALYTKKFVKYKLLEMDQGKLNQTAETLLNQLSQVSVDISLRKYIASSLQYLLMNDTKFVIREILNPHCIKLMQQSKNQSDAQVNYQFLGFFAQTLMSSFSSLTRDLNVFMQKTIQTFCMLNLRVFKYVAQTIQSQDKPKIIHIFRILKLYSYTLKIYLRKMMLAQIQTIKLLYNQTLSQLITTSLAFTLSNNQLTTQIIFLNPKSDVQIVQLYHSIKSDYVQCITYIMRAIFLQFKQKQMQLANPVLKNTALIPSFIFALSQLFNQMLYYKIKSMATIKLVQEIIACLIIAVRNVMYFDVFVQYKKQIVQDCVIKVLQFSQIDVDKFYEDPQDFINQLLQIIQLQSSQYMKNKDKQSISFQSAQQQIQQYTNLRTLASSLLTSFCKHIDSSLPQILSFSYSVLKQPDTNNNNSQTVPKSTLLLMLCILRDQIVDRQDASCQVLAVACQLLANRKLPLKVGDPQNTPISVYQENIEYLIIMLTVYRFISLTPEVKENQLKIAYQVVYAVLSGEHQVSDAIQYAGFDLVMGLCQRQQKFQSRFIQILNQLLLVQKTNKVKCLQTLIALFNNPSKSLQQNPNIVILTIQNLCKIVYLQSQKKAGINQLLVNHCWNVISSVCQNDKFIPKLIPQIEQAVMPLLQFIDGKQNLDYQEDIFMMMSSFIGKAKTVTQNQLVMFQIIPKLFYTQYQFMFGHAFETLHIFILYGSQILASAPQAIKAIVDMAVTCMNTTKVKDKERNQSQNCQGVIILQSLIMSCGNSFTTQLWIDIVKFLTSRLQNPPIKTHILHSNILATIALSLTLTYKFFSNDDCQILLNRVLQNYYCFVVQYSIKVVIVAFSQLLTLNNLPFVGNRFTMLLDATITLLEGYQKKDVFNKNPITMEQKDYDISLQTLKNMVTQIDEIQHLKKNILRVKQQNPTILQKAINELPQAKAQYLKQLVNSTKVNNQARPIFKIKK